MPHLCTVFETLVESLLTRRPRLPDVLPVPPSNSQFRDHHAALANVVCRDLRVTQALTVLMPWTAIQETSGNAVMTFE